MLNGKLWREIYTLKHDFKQRELASLGFTSVGTLSLQKGMHTEEAHVKYCN